MIFSTKKILLLFGMAFLSACSTLPTPPKGTIEAKTMADVLVEIHLTEAKLGKVSFQDYDSSKVAFRDFEKRIFRKYKIDSVTYKKSYDFYATEPEWMVQIYGDVNKILEEKKKKKVL